MDSGFSHFQRPTCKPESNPKSRNENHFSVHTTSCEAIGHVLDLLSRLERHNMISQVKAYLKVSGGEKHPLYDKVDFKKGTEWTNQASMVISECCDVQKIGRGATWNAVDDDCFTQVTATLGLEFRELTKEAVSLEIELLIEENELS